MGLEDQFKDVSRKDIKRLVLDCVRNSTWVGITQDGTCRGIHYCKLFTFVTSWDEKLCPYLALPAVFVDREGRASFRYQCGREDAGIIQ